MAEQETRSESQTRSEPPRPARSQWGRYAFIALLIIVVIAVWWSQRRDPALDGWLRDYDEAAQLASENDRRILVFFTETPMNARDRESVTQVLADNNIQAVLERKNVVRVHLSLNRDADEAQRLGIDSTPAYVLLSPEGEPIRDHQGYLRAEALRAEFLEPSDGGP